MKFFYWTLVLFSFKAFSWGLIDCPSYQIRVYMPNVGQTCVGRMQAWENPSLINCNATGFNPNWFNHFPPAIYQPQQQPWWVTQGNMYYPNLHYPGAWNYPGMNQSHYPGSGEVFAAKPNVYVDSVHLNKKFEFKFTSKEKLSFLTTTPIKEDNTWKGILVEKDKFEVRDKFVADEVRYDYLFYDIRLPKEGMQFEHGVCTTRDEAISWMLKDLKEMDYSAIALQDFEEHWKAKIPLEYPYYCIYPQYNAQLDKVLPVTISTEQTSFTRSLYIIRPHKTPPDIAQVHEVPFPQRDPASFRPTTKVKREIMFREWGVAFLGF
jgi:hypothetical protein